MIIVSRDGSGDYSSLQAAVDAVAATGRAPTIILVRAGEYREKVVVHRNNLRIVGESPENTVLVWNGCAKDTYPTGEEKGTFLSSTLMITGHNVEVENLTIRNDAGDGRKVGQAVAVYAAGDRGVWRNCRLIAHQDTLFCGPLRIPNVIEDIGDRRGAAEAVSRVEDGHLTWSRQYFEHCYIEGDVDFIFGSYRCWFEKCVLFMGARGGWYTAANTNRLQPHGMVFHRCRLTGACEEGAASLGRPWRAYARTVFLDCEMDAHVAPDGFRDWDEERVVTERYGEWRTSGARAEQSPRHPAQKRLTDEDAAVITLPEVIGGWDGWRPDRRIPTWFLCGDSTMADYPPERAPMSGWGQQLQAQLEETAWIRNEAVNGRSSKSFIDEHRLEAIDLCLRPGDRLIVCFGHNDEKQQDPSRYTSPDGTYPEYLKKYLETARRRGAEPILVTSIPRRLFSADGSLVPTHGAYPAAVRALAEREKVRLIDLESAAAALVQAAGPEGSKSLYCHVPAGHPHYPEGAADNSHLHERGAVKIAKLFLDLLSGRAKASAPDAASAETSADLGSLIAREDWVLGDSACYPGMAAFNVKK